MQVARDAIQKLQDAFRSASEDVSAEEVRSRLDGVVRSYGGDPSDYRHRLDALLKGNIYWK